jgi:hypothetical protein
MPAGRIRLEPLVTTTGELEAGKNVFLQQCIYDARQDAKNSAAFFTTAYEDVRAYMPGW